MSVLAVFLVAVGMTDICRTALPAHWPALAAGPAATVVCAALAGLWHLSDIALLLIVAAATVSWTLWCRRAETRGTGQVAPLLLFGAVAVALLLMSGLATLAAGPLAQWLQWVGQPDLEPPAR